jgi:hypothetical protein
MFATDITLTRTSGSKTYSLQSITGGRSVRSDAAAPLGQPNTLTISHQVAQQSGIVVDRHLARFDDSTAGTIAGSTVVTNPSVQLVLSCPRQVTTVAQMKDALSALTAFLAVGANVDKLLNNEP